MAKATEPLHLDLSRAGRVDVPAWHGRFEVAAVTSGGLEPHRLRHCELRERRGGEQGKRGEGGKEAVHRGFVVFRFGRS